MTYLFFLVMQRKYPYPHHIKKSEKFLEGKMLDHSTLTVRSSAARLRACMHVCMGSNGAALSECFDLINVGQDMQRGQHHRYTCMI